MKPSVESLQARIKELEKKCEDLEKVNRNIFDSEEEQIKDLREQIAKHKNKTKNLLLILPAGSVALYLRFFFQFLSQASVLTCTLKYIK